jgi:hypothetical protein
LSSLPDNKFQSSTNQKSDKTRADVATTVVMAKSNSGDETGSSDQEESEEDNSANNGTTDTAEGFTVSTLGDESRRRTDVNHVKGNYCYWFIGNIYQSTNVLINLLIYYIIIVITGEEEEEKLFEVYGY